MRVVVREAARRIELVDGDAARVADEQLRDRTALHGEHGRVARRQDVDRFVRPVAATFLESALERFER